jgi:hypothetical protein
MCKRIVERKRIVCSTERKAKDQLYRPPYKQTAPASFPPLFTTTAPTYTIAHAFTTAGHRSGPAWAENKRRRRHFWSLGSFTSRDYFKPGCADAC